MIDELDEFLMSDQTPDDCMQLSDLDGFLTGIVVGPELIMPSEWMPAIWQGGEPEFDDMERAERIMGVIMARYNEIIHLLDDEPGALEPIFYEAPDGRVTTCRTSRPIQTSQSTRPASRASSWPLGVKRKGSLATSGS